MQFKIRSFRNQRGALSSGAPPYAGLEKKLEEASHGGWALVSLSPDPFDVYGVIAVFQRPDGAPSAAEREATDALIKYLSIKSPCAGFDEEIAPLVKAVLDARKAAAAHE